MKTLFIYLRLIAHRYKDLVVWVFGLAGLVAYLEGQNLPFEPAQRVLFILILALFYCAFAVWTDERRNAQQARSDLDALKTTVPEFEIRVVTTTRYSAKDVIAVVEKELAHLERSIVPKSNLANVSVVDSALIAVGRQNDSVARAMGLETVTEKRDRLTEHLLELKRFEARLAHLYRVSLTINGTRTDKNIQTTIAADLPAKFQVEDHYVERQLPTTEAPRSILDNLVPALPFNRFPHVQSKVYLAGYAKGDSASSTISSLNADRVISLFGDECYIEVAGSEFNLLVTIYSEKRHERQTLTVPVNMAMSDLESIGSTHHKE